MHEGRVFIHMSAYDNATSHSRRKPDWIESDNNEAESCAPRLRPLARSPIYLPKFRSHFLDFLFLDAYLVTTSHALVAMLLNTSRLDLR